MFSCKGREAKREGIDNIVDGSGKYSYCYPSCADSIYSDLSLSLHMTHDFAYDRFNFELEVITPDSVTVIDTMSVPVKINFIGRKILIVNILSDLMVERGRYNFHLRGLMPADCVGIEDIKLRIVPKK